MKKRERIYKIFIGYDPKERVAAIVLDHLLRRDTPETMDITFLDKEKLARAGLLYRPYQMITGQKIDTKDQRPFSTQFSFSRFLIPALMLWEGWALYMDCDMFPRTDITELFKEYDDPDLPLYCVKHKYEPTDEYKMDNQKQSKTKPQYLVRRSRTPTKTRQHLKMWHLCSLRLTMWTLLRRLICLAPSYLLMILL